MACAERHAVIPSERLLFSLSSRARAKPDEGSSDVTKNGNRVDSSAKAFGMTERGAFEMTERVARNDKKRRVRSDITPPK